MTRTAYVCAFAVACLAAVSGCQSYEVVQRNVFSDEDGNLVYVDYGRSDKDHVNTFTVPHTGKVMDFKSKLVVRATLPDETTFTAWQCMNFLPRGTMYKTDDERWMLLANGFSCTVYRQAEDDAANYIDVYRGVLCETPEIGKGVKRDERWKTVPPGGRVYKPQEAKVEAPRQ